MCDSLINEFYLLIFSFYFFFFAKCSRVTKCSRWSTWKTFGCPLTPCTNVWFIWYNDCFLVCLTIHDTWEKNKVCEKLNENHAYMWEGIYYPSVLLIARHFCYIKPCLVLFNFEIKRYWLLSASGEIWAEDLFSLASLRQDEIVAAFGEYMWKYLFHLRIGSRKIAWVAAQKKACSRVS